MTPASLPAIVSALGVNARRFDIDVLVADVRKDPSKYLRVKVSLF